MRRLVYLCVLCMTALMVGCTEDEVPIFGDVYGTITDSKTGEPVRNAEVILSPTNATTISGSDGHFEFRSLEAGQYKISVSSDGYEGNSRQITVVPGKSTACDMHLTPKAVVEIFNVDPLALNFGTTQTQMAVTVTNSSARDTQWSLDLGQNTWLKASPIAGQIGAGKSQTIVFYTNRANLTAETSGIVTFSALGGSSSLTVNCSPSQQVSSIMEVTPLDIDFGDLSTEQIFRIKNKSNALLNWTLFGLDEDAITVSDTSGTIQSGNSKVVAIKLDRSKLDGNHLTTSFMISDGTVDQQVNINVGSHESNVSNNPDEPTNEPMGRLELPSLMLDFGVDYKSLPFTINNAGDATLDWSIIDVQDEIFSFSPDSGTLEAGNSTEIQVSIDRENLPAGSAESAFTISDGVNKYVVTVKYEKSENSEGSGEPDDSDGKLQVSPSTLDFGAAETQLYFNLYNVRNNYSNCRMHIDGIPAAVDFSFESETRADNNTYTFLYRADLVRSRMTGDIDVPITITFSYSDGTTESATVRVAATKSNIDYSAGKISVSPTELDFSSDLNGELNFSVTNTGTSHLKWTMTYDPEVLIINSQISGSITTEQNVGSTTQHRVSLYNTSKVADTYITLTNDSNPSDTHSVHIIISNNGGGSADDEDDPSDDDGTSTAGIPDNQIWYTSTDGNVVTPYSASAFGVNIASNVYENGKGVITFDGDVAVIGYQAFHNCHNLASITLPNSVTSIVKEAFRWCSRLVSITIPNSVNLIGDDAFVACYDLKSITIPNNVNSIGSGAFYSCKSLESITLPNGITSIADLTFYDCEKLTSITIPSSVMSIGRYAFEECSNLTSINIPDNVTSIGYQAFSECSNLTSINIPSGVTSIEKNTFIDCSKLASINLPDGIISIGEQAFYRCSSLTSINIPASVTSIDSYAFMGCNALSQVHITNLSAWCKITFDYGGANPLCNKHYDYLGQEVYADLFLNGTKVTDLVIPADITTIKSYTFYSCHTLKSITIHNNVSTIGSSAFSGCANVSTLTIGSGVTNIQYAFDATNSLSTIYCKAVTPPQLSESTFSNVATDCKIYVPTSSVDAYKAATNWSTYADKIVGYNF